MKINKIVVFAALVTGGAADTASLDDVRVSRGRGFSVVLDSAELAASV